MEIYNYEDLKNSRLLTDKEVINDEVAEKGFTVIMRIQE